MKEYYEEITSKLETLYGSFDADKKRFKNSPNSKIARDLGYSDSQFSRLINGTATTNEYQRTLQNVNRILYIRDLENSAKNINPKDSNRFTTLWMPFALVTSVLLISAIFFILNKDEEESLEFPKDYTLQWAFETDFVNPYTKLSELPENCDYPCYRLQGEWSLKEKYKVPLYVESNGFHYLAVASKMYTRCVTDESANGELLEGYEYQQHEIWFNKTTAIIKKSGSDQKESTVDMNTYQSLDLEKDDRFVKIATINTFFRNQFSLTDSIRRNGQVIGRELLRIGDDVLSENLSPKEIQFIKKKLTNIANNNLEDFSRPINCSASPLPAVDYDSVENGSLMSFECHLTTNNLPIGYVKTFELDKQFIRTKCRSAVE
ncbi:hypothetical protein SAMN05192588_2747 [Nonlabens sp. Hel1_33_55]|nr:hypothetical protein SAMN05192588_2747 [Nonlabens sp. Hel1_33_55]